PYLGRLNSAREWDVVVRTSEVWGNMKGKLGEALGASGWWNMAIWGLLFLVTGFLLGVGYLQPRTLKLEGQSEQVLLFSGSILVLGTATYFTFLFALGYPTQAWYYLSLLAISAVSIDLAWASLNHLRWARQARIWVAVVVAIGSLWP